jgi:superfamily II DNA or RNA helicase
LIHDEKRNELIARDVAERLAQGRIPLVITDRRDHLRLLDDAIHAQVGDKPVLVMRLDGGTPVPDRRRILAELEAALGQGQRICLLSTASFIGEGFDLPPLDTLFLAMPISFKGRMVQYAGRLHRAHEGKKDVAIYDYVDSSCAMTLKMYRKRLIAYRNMGYSVEEPVGMIGGRNVAEEHREA